MPKRNSSEPWYKGKIVNPELSKAVDAHRKWKSENYINCDLKSPSYATAASHASWRKHFKEHTGDWPPKSWLTQEESDALNAPKEEHEEEGNPNLNTKQFNPNQGNWVLDVEQAHYDRDPRKED